MKVYDVLVDVLVHVALIDDVTRRRDKANWQRKGKGKVMPAGDERRNNTQMNNRQRNESREIRNNMMNKQ